MERSDDWQSEGNGSHVIVDIKSVATLLNVSRIDHNRSYQLAQTLWVASQCLAVVRAPRSTQLISTERT